MVVTETDVARLRGKHESYLTDHYVGLHNMVVSVALAVAGVAAASLLGLPSPFHAFAVLLWMMLGTSLLAIAVAYAGTVTGAPFLPARLPAMPDLMLPLLLAVTEFFLFGVLAHQVSAVASPQATVTSWYVVSSCFGVFAALSILRARSVINGGWYSDELRSTVVWYSRRLSRDAAAALSTAVVSILPIVFLSAARSVPATLDYIVVSVLAGQYCLGFGSHSSTRKGLMRALQGH